MKKFILFLILLSTGPVFAGAYALYDYSNHSYDIESNKHEIRSIASITKLFTAITILNSGVDLTEKVKVNGKSRGRVPQGALMTRMDLMQAMLISSDNRAAETLANHHFGGFSQFIKDVNSYVQKNNLYDTQIVDSTGLLSNNKSSVADLIEFLSLIKDNPTIRSIAGERNAEINAPRGKNVITINLNNTNPEIFIYDNILISKTGFTSSAGRCVLMLIEKNKKLYAVAVLGQRNVTARTKLVKKLLHVDTE